MMTRVAAVVAVAVVVVVVVVAMSAVPADARSPLRTLHAEFADAQLDDSRARLVFLWHTSVARPAFGAYVASAYRARDLAFFELDCADAYAEERPRIDALTPRADRMQRDDARVLLFGDDGDSDGTNDLLRGVSNATSDRGLCLHVLRRVRIPTLPVAMLLPARTPLAALYTDAKFTPNMALTPFRLQNWLTHHAHIEPRAEHRPLPLPRAVDWRDELVPLQPWVEKLTSRTQLEYAVRRHLRVSHPRARPPPSATDARRALVVFFHHPQRCAGVHELAWFNTAAALQDEPAVRLATVSLLATHNAPLRAELTERMSRVRGVSADCVVVALSADVPPGVERVLTDSLELHSLLVDNDNDSDNDNDNDSDNDNGHVNDARRPASVRAMALHFAPGARSLLDQLSRAFALPHRTFNSDIEWRFDNVSDVDANGRALFRAALAETPERQRALAAQLRNDDDSDDSGNAATPSSSSSSSSSFSSLDTDDAQYAVHHARLRAVSRRTYAELLDALADAETSLDEDVELIAERVRGALHVETRSRHRSAREQDQQQVRRNALLNALDDVERERRSHAPQLPSDEWLAQDARRRAASERRAAAAKRLAPTASDDVAPLHSDAEREEARAKQRAREAKNAEAAERQQQLAQRRADAYRRAREQSQQATRERQATAAREEL